MSKHSSDYRNYRKNGSPRGDVAGKALACVVHTLETTTDNGDTVTVRVQTCAPVAVTIGNPAIVSSGYRRGLRAPLSGAIIVAFERFCEHYGLFATLPQADLDALANIREHNKNNRRAKEYPQTLTYIVSADFRLRKDITSDMLAQLFKYQKWCLNVELLLNVAPPRGGSGQGEFSMSHKREHSRARFIGGNLAIEREIANKRHAEMERGEYSPPERGEADTICDALGISPTDAEKRSRMVRFLQIVTSGKLDFSRFNLADALTSGMWERIGQLAEYEKQEACSPSVNDGMCGVDETTKTTTQYVGDMKRVEPTNTIGQLRVSPLAEVLADKQPFTRTR